MPIPSMQKEHESTSYQKGLKAQNEIWTAVQTFKTFEEANKVIKKSQCWSYLNEKPTKNCSETLLSMLFSKTSCLSANGSDKYIIFENNRDHVHPEDALAFGKMSEEASAIIKRMVRQGQTLMEK